MSFTSLTAKNAVYYSTTTGSESYSLSTGSYVSTGSTSSAYTSGYFE